MAAVSVVSAALCGCGEDKVPKNNDYANSTLQFDFYGYSSASDGRYNWDGTWHDVGEDFRTAERVKEYKDAGFTIYFPQSAAAFSGNEAYESSQAKKAMDNAIEAGIDKVILMDPRIQTISKSEKPAIGNTFNFNGKEYNIQSEADLDAMITEFMAPYRTHEAFYGIMLGDEPFYKMATAYGQVYKSIKRVAPDCFIQYNLNPITAGTGVGADGGLNINARFPALAEGDEGYGEDLNEDTELILRYEKYLNLFLDSTGADFLQYDQYPFRHADKVDEYYLLGLQVAASIVKERNLKFYFVTQTYGQTDGVPNPRMLREKDLYWMNNMLLGFGIKQISYFTYFTKQDNTTEHFIDGNSFLTWKGEKTNIYHWMKQIMAEEQKIAPTILSFNYNTSKIYLQMPTVFNSTYAMRSIETPDFVALKDVQVNKEVGLVTELYDAEKDNYMYMVQNITDTQFRGSKTYQTTTLTFDAQYKYAMVFVKGKKKFVKLNKGKITFKHFPGEATYVMPY